MFNASASLGSVTPISPTPESNTSAPQLSTQVSTLLGEFAQWRMNKKTPAESIPDSLWEKIFELEKTHPPEMLRSLFGISTKQYQKKSTEFKESGTSPAREAKLKNPHDLCQVTIKKNPYEAASLPSAKTLIVEFCREDGKIMKIHTTQDSIPTLMHTFFGE